MLGLSHPLFIVIIMSEQPFDEGLEPMTDVDRGRAVVGLLDAVSPTGSSVPELRDLASVLGRARVKIDSLMCEIAAEVGRVDTGVDAASVLQDSGHLSGRDARRVDKVAGRLAEMPNTAERLAAGDITMDHAAALVTAAEQCGAAVVDGDSDLLERAEKTSPESFARQARRFAAAESPDRGEALLERQRRNRAASVFVDSDTGMGKVIGAFDPISFNLIEQVVDGHTDALWRADGGRDGQPEQVRTSQQRRADALFELITGRDALTRKPLEPGSGGGAGSFRAKASAQLVAVADIGVLDGTNPQGRCEIIGTGPVPPGILAQLSPDTRLTGMIFAGPGRPLWMGRSIRLANTHQHLAIAVRDRGCMVCGAPMHRCEIHHIQEWENGGPTDIDNLTALCGPHHRAHHNRQRTDGTRSGKGQPPADTGSGPLDGGPHRAHRNGQRSGGARSGDRRPADGPSRNGPQTDGARSEIRRPPSRRQQNRTRDGPG